MKTEDNILELLKEKPLLMERLGERLEVPILEVVGAVAFLKKYELVVTSPTDKGGGLVEITPAGQLLLNMPELSDDELPSDQLEVLERHWGDELDEQVKGAVEEGEFSEATITSIKAREDKRQREILEGPK